MKLLLSVFVLGGRGASQLPGCEGGRGASQLWSWGCLFLFWGGGGPVSFRSVKGEGGRVSFNCCCLFLFWGASQLPGVCVCVCLRGMEASQLPGGRKGPVSFGVGCETVAVCFCFGGGGAVSFGAVKGEGGPVSFGVGCETVAVCFCFGGAGGQSASGL